MALVCNCGRLTFRQWQLCIATVSKRVFSEGLATQCISFNDVVTRSDLHLDEEMSLNCNSLDSAGNIQESSDFPYKRADSFDLHLESFTDPVCEDADDQPLLTKRLFSRIGSKKKIDEYMPLLTSLLSSKDTLKEAEKLFELLGMRYPTEISLKMTSFLCNIFIRHYLDQSNSFSEQKARDWYLRMKKYPDNAKPDILTFSLFANYCLEKKYTESLKIYLRDFLMECTDGRFSVDDLLQYESINDRQLLSCLLEDVMKEVQLEDEKLQSSSIFDKINRQLSSKLDCTNSVLSRLIAKFCDTKSVPFSLLPPSSTQSVEIEGQHSKSNGLAYVKKALRALSNKTDAVEDSYRLQEMLEADSLSTTLEKLNAERENFVKMSRSLDLANIRFMFSEWILTLSKILQVSLRTLPTEDNEKKSNFAIYSLLKRISSEKIALITLLEIFKVRPESEDYGNSVRFVTISSAIGAAIEKEVLAGSYQNEKSSKILRYRQILLRSVPREELFLEENRNSLSHFMQATKSIYNTHLPDWSPLNRIKVGAYCLSLVVPNLKVEFNGEMQPLITHEITRVGPKELQGVIRLHPHVLELVSKDASIVTADPSCLPMLVPPQPWLTFDSGGYLSHKNTCVRLRGDMTQLALLKENDTRGLLKNILLGLDILGSVPWVINEAIFEVMVKAWNLEIEIAGLLPKYYETSSNSMSSSESSPCTLKKDVQFYYKKDGTPVSMSKNEFFSIHSQRCDLNYKLEIAKSYIGTTFYFPHNIDFRGRAYPIPPHFNHIGSDFCRGLLKFAVKKPLGDDGLRWLKIHLANLYGNNKVSLDERVRFVDENMEHIRASATNALADFEATDRESVCASKSDGNLANAAIKEESIENLKIADTEKSVSTSTSDEFDNSSSGICLENTKLSNSELDLPASGNRSTNANFSNSAPNSSVSKGNPRWWSLADDPWQCLATCMELIAAIDCGNPSEFLSNLPVHQDGSCNGPQHYAALGRDELGARQVNLAPSLSPQDVYGTVAKLVEEELERDLSNEDSKIRGIAHILRGKITRKIVKQPVMTNVYGVTSYGSQKQIRERLKEFNVVDPERYVEASAYISKKVFHSLDKLFSTARLLQNWLAFCAKEISLSVPPELQHVIELKFSKSADNSSSSSPSPSPSPSSSSSSSPSSLHQSIPYPMTLVAWTNPAGFPAVQPYRKKSIEKLKTALQVVSVWVPSDNIPCDVQKQLAGFPPNFIHSLDASHMFQTSIACFRSGITFASVHDSFWTHAADVDKMGNVLRDEFVKMHSGNLMQGLRDEFLLRYGKNSIPVVKDGEVQSWRPIVIPPLPSRGTFDIELVKESVYFFS